MSEHDPAVRAREVHVRFGDHGALDGLDLDAPSGAITALLGPNGAGKTTFVRCIATLQAVMGGTLHVAGLDVRRRPGEVRRSIGLAGQHAAVVDQLTGWENLVLVARLYGQTRRGAREAARGVIDALYLADIADRRAGHCSGGQRRRLDLAASLVGDPRLLLLDEPTTGVDPHSRRELWELIARLPARGTSVLLTTQYLEEAARLADHVVIIDRGTAIAAGTPAQLRQAAGATCLTVRRPGLPPACIAAELEATLRAEVRTDRFGVTAVGDFGFHEAAAALRAGGVDPTEVAYHPPTLDEVFLSLTSRQESA